MNLERLESELGLIVQDASLEPYFRDWINDTLLSLAGDFDFPALKLLAPEYFQVTTADWIYDAPEDFQKNLFRCVDANSNTVLICRDISTLDIFDIDHDDTGDNITHIVSIETGMSPKLAVYPLADDTLRLWYYKKPTLLDDPGDEPDFIPVEFHDRVIIPRVVVKNYRILQDLAVQAPHESLLYWESQVRLGLYGAPGGDPGLVQKLALATTPHRHGGRDPLL